MKSEDKLKRLFETLRTEEASTTVTDVASWIKASIPQNNVNKIKKVLYKKLVIMISIATIIVSGILLISGNKEPGNTPKHNNIKQVEETDSSKILVSQVNPIHFNVRKIVPPVILPFLDTGSITSSLEETISESEIILPKPTFIAENGLRNNIKSNNGFWFSSNDSLNVDTLFSGVKSVVFKGDKCDVSINGSERKDLSMKYNYLLNAKGVFSRKKEANCKLSYELKDSVLTIHQQRGDQKFNGVSLISEKSKIVFNIPENMDVRIDSDLGDIEIDGLKNTSTFLYSSLGDITATNIAGTIDFDTALGDVSMNSVTGKIKANTDLGDVSGENIKISADSQLSSSLGNIDVQLSNTMDECSLDLSTSLGKVKVERADLKTKSQNKFKTVGGKFKVIMNSSLGNIIVR